MNRKIKWLYFSFDKFDFKTITTVYNKNSWNSLAFQNSTSSRDLGKQANSDSINFVKLNTTKEMKSFFLLKLNFRAFSYR